jgi:hypothetical protein
MLVNSPLLTWPTSHEVPSAGLEVLPKGAKPPGTLSVVVGGMAGRGILGRASWSYLKGAAAGESYQVSYCRDGV